jgi:hypothetical protein
MNDAGPKIAAIGMLEHFFYRGLGDQECGADVEGDHIVQVSFGNVDKRLGNIHARVIEQDIEAINAGESGIHFGSIGDIASDYARPAFRAGDMCGDLFEFATRSAEQDQFRTGLGESERRLRAEAAAGSGDQRDAAIEAKRRRKRWGFSWGFGLGVSPAYWASPEVVLTLTLRLP